MSSPSQPDDLELELLLDAVQQLHDYDFRQYSRASLKRRVRQALPRLGCANVAELQHRVIHDPDVMPQLLPLLTVQVSDLFRDPGYFRAIRDEVIPHLATYPTLKVWIAGCSSGEEAYSLAILWREAGLENRTVFYATDLNPAALAAARAGAYAASRAPAFTRNHQRSGAGCSLSEYYTAAYDRILFDRTLRDRIVFSVHSLVSDQVFSEVNFVSCRNVLIYFERPLQDRAIGLFRDALVPGGFLGLGGRETLRFSRHAPSFSEFSPSHRVYRRTLA